MQDFVFFWFRRDLRLEDNHALYRALSSGLPVLPVFIFDSIILTNLDDRSDARVTFIHRAVQALHAELQALGSTLIVRQGEPSAVWEQLLQEYPGAKGIFTNRDYESYALERDQSVADYFNTKGLYFQSFKDQVIFEQTEIAKKDGDTYTVFTPYSKTWLQRLQSLQPAGQDLSEALLAYPSEQRTAHFLAHPATALPSLAQIGFQETSIPLPDIRPVVSAEILQHYAERRDLPAIEGTSRLGVHLRFGTISVRAVARQAWLQNSPVFLNELIWRDFYSMILSNHPQVEKQAFRSEYENIPWLNDEKQFEAWCQGRTGYPLVDAGMRQLNATGYMHNRVRMVVASFLSKHLLIDWRWGEAYFAKKLLDFDLASNNGGWQWAAGCGTDAAPYFRIFNPTAQTQKFDPKGVYIRRWVPEWGTSKYPLPIVAHEAARLRCLAAYKAGLGR